MTGGVMLSAAMGGRRSHPRSGARLGLLAGLGCATAFACWASLWVQAAGQQRWLVGYATEGGELGCGAAAVAARVGQKQGGQVGLVRLLGPDAPFLFPLSSFPFLFLISILLYAMGYMCCQHVYLLVGSTRGQLGVVGSMSRVGNSRALS